jgi:hypothetical protein
VAGIIYPSASHNAVNMYLKLKPNGEIMRLADLVPQNKIMVTDNEPIPNKALILRTCKGGSSHPDFGPVD